MKKAMFLLVWLFYSIFSSVHSVHSATVDQLNITGGSVSLNLGPSLSISGNFTQNGTLVMGQYQPPPNIFPPIPIDGHTFSFFTDPSGGPAPTGQTSGTTLTVDLSSLFAGITGPLINGTLNIGGLATGSYNPTTGAFSISWTHIYTSISSATMTWQGIVNVSPVPLPAAVVLFATGLLGLAGLSWCGTGRFSSGLS